MNFVWQGILVLVLCLQSAGIGGCAEKNIQQRCTQVKGQQYMTA